MSTSVEMIIVRLWVAINPDSYSRGLQQLNNGIGCFQGSTQRPIDHEQSFFRTPRIVYKQCCRAFM
jgi:hypothetical protein